MEPGRRPRKKKSTNAPKISDLYAEKRKRALLKQQYCDQVALHIVGKLIEGPVSEDVFLQSLKYLDQCHFQDVVEERAITKLCGYVICTNKIPELPNQTYHISTKSNKVYDVVDRKNFCSNFCYTASNYIKNQVLTSPLWFRDQEKIPEFKLLVKAERIIPGEEIDQGIIKIEKEPEFISTTQFTQNVINEFPDNDNVFDNEDSSSDENEDIAPQRTTFDPDRPSTSHQNVSNAPTKVSNVPNINVNNQNGKIDTRNGGVDVQKGSVVSQNSSVDVQSGGVALENDLSSKNQSGVPEKVSEISENLEKMSLLGREPPALPLNNENFFHSKLFSPNLADILNENHKYFTALDSKLNEPEAKPLKGILSSKGKEKVKKRVSFNETREEEGEEKKEIRIFKKPNPPKKMNVDRNLEDSLINKPVIEHKTIFTSSEPSELKELNTQSFSQGTSQVPNLIKNEAEGKVEAEVEKTPNDTNMASSQLNNQKKFLKKFETYENDNMLDEDKFWGDDVDLNDVRIEIERASELEIKQDVQKSGFDLENLNVKEVNLQKSGSRLENLEVKDGSVHKGGLNVEQISLGLENLDIKEEDPKRGIQIDNLVIKEHSIQKSGSECDNSERKGVKSHKSVWKSRKEAVQKEDNVPKAENDKDKVQKDGSESDNLEIKDVKGHKSVWKSRKEVQNENTLPKVENDRVQVKESGAELDTSERKGVILQESSSGVENKGIGDGSIQTSGLGPDNSQNKDSKVQKCGSVLNVTENKDVKTHESDNKVLNVQKSGSIGDKSGKEGAADQNRNVKVNRVEKEAVIEHRSDLKHEMLEKEVNKIQKSDSERDNLENSVTVKVKSGSRRRKRTKKHSKTENSEIKAADVHKKVSQDNSSDNKDLNVQKSGSELDNSESNDARVKTSGSSSESNVSRIQEGAPELKNKDTKVKSDPTCEIPKNEAVAGQRSVWKNKKETKSKEKLLKASNKEATQSTKAHSPNATSKNENDAVPNRCEIKIAPKLEYEAQSTATVPTSSESSEKTSKNLENIFTNVNIKSNTDPSKAFFENQVVESKASIKQKMKAQIFDPLKETQKIGFKNNQTYSQAKMLARKFHGEKKDSNQLKQIIQKISEKDLKDTPSNEALSNLSKPPINDDRLKNTKQLEEKKKQPLCRLKTMPLNVSESFLDTFESCIGQWFTMETMVYLFGEDKVKSVISDKKFKQYLNAKRNTIEEMEKIRKYQEICKKLNLMELTDKYYDESIKDLKRKPLPNFEDIKTQAEKMDLRVQAFYSGCFEVIETDTGSESEGEKTDDEDNPALVKGIPAVLPLVDNKDYLPLRKKIFMSSLNRTVAKLCELLDQSPNVVQTDLKELIDTFSFDSKNIVFKTAEWPIVTIFLIKLLGLKNKQYFDLLRSKNGQEYSNDIVKPVFGKGFDNFFTKIVNVEHFVNTYLDNDNF